ncbi:TetR/AcrR family transcriptional regulator [Arthrobacter cryoconiti]|uniref:TetR/AcrR family transcriptional regulator n=1 Tax=Arthrobacter cryoconiti TaxID=748907 RepID=A0ABV8R3V0_9MICC|nr:TetR-like C-terminal domain-containing protein [Arthrobacter cryoconiti]MCC9066779.1 WHG domain-containing protein [Arthrobacter cryoconiti]
MPRVGLTRERVVEEAAVLADEVGLGQLTLAALAERLGVRQPSLYKHIESLAGLRRNISIQAKGELGNVLLRAAVGRSGADAIHSMSRAYRTWALEHPARYAAAQIVAGPHDEEDAAASLAAIAIITDVLIAYELEGDDAIDAIRAFRSTLHGFVALEAEGSFGLDVDIERSFERMIRGFVTALTNWTETIATHDGGR